MDINHLPDEVHVNKGHWKGFCHPRIGCDAPQWRRALLLPAYLFVEDRCEWCSFILVSNAGPVCPTQTWPVDPADIPFSICGGPSSTKGSCRFSQVAGQQLWCVWTVVVEGHINVKQNITNNMPDMMRHTYRTYFKYIFMYWEVQSIQWKCKPLLNISFE